MRHLLLKFSFLLFILLLQKTGNCYSAHKYSPGIKKTNCSRIFNSGKRGEMALTSGNIPCSNTYCSPKFSTGTGTGNRYGLCISTYITTRLTGFISISSLSSILLIFPFHYFW
ncbi:MAG: hypothetical protein BGP14_12700 [Sphingobacteriales bacterium 44-15]|nr:MAG: hypothetical protein BGP14_12700 [Sphingobacteriales bacterium 44-15]